jgi:clan AA aspartic protease
MGFVSVKIGIEDINRPGSRREVDLLVDTGALYSIVPGTVLREMGIEPRQRHSFELADGTVIERDGGEARFLYDRRSAVSSVIFGERADTNVLGVVTLEELGLEVDPVRKEIRPARLILY